MPTTKTEEITAAAIKPGDEYNHPTKGFVLVTGVKHGDVNTKITYHLGAVADLEYKNTHVKSTDPIWVRREVPTAEELAFKAADLRKAKEDIILAELMGAPQVVQSLRARVAADIAKNGLMNVRPEDITTEAMWLEVSRWGARWFFSPDVRDRFEGDVCRYLIETVELLKETVLRGPDDGWSGRGNDAKRCEWDGIRKLVTDSYEVRIVSLARHLVEG